MRTIVYIDGFNLYYRLLKSQPQFKWLNPVALCQLILDPENQIDTVRYYTARVSPHQDPLAPARQKVYLNALATESKITIHYGNFLRTPKWAELVIPPCTKGGAMQEFSQPYPTVVRVWKTEEKGSDVNLASHLLRDAFNNQFDVAGVLSNDTDLVEPIRIVTQELQLPVGIICPVPKPAAGLSSVASFVRHIRNSHLRDAQFSDTLSETNLSKPSTWV